MSQENIDRLRGVYDAWAKGEFRAGSELLAPDIVFEPRSDGGAALGSDAIQGHMREFLAQWREFRVEAERFEDFGDCVLVTERQYGVGRSSGVETKAIFYAVWTFRDGLVTRLRWDTERASAIAAAGLSE